MSDTHQGKGFFCAYKHRDLNCAYPPPKTTFVVPLRSLISSQCDSTNYFGVAVISHKQPSLVLNLAATNQFDTYSNNDEDTQYIKTHKIKNKRTPEIPETTTTTTPVQATFYSCLLQRSSST